MDWIKSKAGSAYEWSSSKVSGGAQWVSETAHSTADWASEKAGAAKTAVVEGAKELYHDAGEGLTGVKNYVAEKGGQAVDYVSDKAVKAKDYVAEKGGQAVDYVSDKASDTAQWAKEEMGKPNVMGSLKYANPLFYTGKATEYAGKGVKWAGEKINQGAEAIDKAVDGTDSRWVNNPIVGRSLGAVSGTLGFAGGLVEGVGSLGDWAGRVQQGDQKTIDNTVQTAKSIGEGAAYIQGKVHEGTGALVEKAGESLDFTTMQKLGQGIQRVGQFEQGLASDKTKKVVDTLGETGAHYVGHLAEKEGQAIKWVGDKTGSETIANAGSQVEQGGSLVAKQTENVLVQKIDQAYEDRKKEYADHPDYAITRDGTRAALEIASLIVAPEALIGKVGEGANVAGKTAKAVEVIDKTVDVARTADKVVDATRTADKVADVTRTADKAADVTSTAGKTVETAKAADTTADVAKTADRTADGVKAADATKTAEGARTAEGAKAADGASDAAKAKAANPENAALVNQIKGELKDQPELAAVLESYINDTSHPMNIVGYLKNPESRQFILGELKDMASKGRPSAAEFKQIVKDTHVPDKPLLNATGAEFGVRDGRKASEVLREDLLKKDGTLFGVSDKPTAGEMQHLKEYAQKLRNETMPALTDDLEAVVAGLPKKDGFPAVNARAKSAEGMQDKIRRMREGNDGKAPRPDYVLADMPDAVGGRITVADPKQMEDVMLGLEKRFGKENIFEKDNFYANPGKKERSPYRVITYTVVKDGVPCEVQVTTLRSSMVADLWHNTGYKKLHPDLPPETIDNIAGLQRSVAAEEHKALAGAQ